MAGMTLKNMRDNGATSIEVSCACGHRGVVDVSEWRETLDVQSAKHRLRCSKCGSRPKSVAPKWEF